MSTTRPPNGRNENGFIVFDIYRIGGKNTITVEVAESEARRILKLLEKILGEE